MTQAAFTPLVAGQERELRGGLAADRLASFPPTAVVNADLSVEELRREGEHDRGSVHAVPEVRVGVDAVRARAGKRLLVLLSYAAADVADVLRGEPRFDQAFLDALVERRFQVVDGLRKPVEDYAAYGCTPDEYVQRFYIGHYNPRGNHFFAFAIKDDLVSWLDPRPPAYDRHGEAPLRALAATLA